MKTNTLETLNQIEQLLNCLLSLIQHQQELRTAGIVTQKELLSILKISPSLGKKLVLRG